jgi:hypothetical protein
MQDLFNPAGLDVLDDGCGAIAFGLVSARVLYARFVGTLSADLGASYAARVARLVATKAPLACFGDASALRERGASAKARLLRLAFAQRECFASFVLLMTGEANLSPQVRSWAIGQAEPLTLLSDPEEFELWLSNVAPASLHADSRELIALHAPSSEPAPTSGVRPRSTSLARPSFGPSERYLEAETRETG